MTEPVRTGPYRGGLLKNELKLSVDYLLLLAVTLLGCGIAAGAAVWAILAVLDR